MSLRGPRPCQVNRRRQQPYEVTGAASNHTRFTAAAARSLSAQPPQTPIPANPEEAEAPDTVRDPPQPADAS